MDWKRMIASALVRRLVYVLVAVVLTWAGIGKAHAACNAGASSQNATCANREEAYIAAVAREQWVLANVAGKLQCYINYVAPPTQPTPRYEVYAKTGTTGTCGFQGRREWPVGQDCPNGEVWNDATKQCDGASCEDADATPTWPGNLGRTRCAMVEVAPGTTLGCEFLGTLGGGAGTDPNYVHWSPVGGTCSPENYTCPTGYIKDPVTGFCELPKTCDGPTDPVTGQCLPPDHCPPGQHKDETGFCKPDPNNCPAGQIKAPDGSCTPDDDSCPAGQAKGADGSCKPDGDGDGTPDGDSDDGTFEGGEDCRQPPKCIGDNIMCGQARIMWRIDCNTRKNATISGGSCDAMPVCTGDGCDERLHKIQIMEWRTACATEKMAGGGPITGTLGDANGNGQPDWTENPGNGQGGDIGAEGDPSGVWAPEAVDPIGADGLDDAGMGYARSCPTLPTVSVMGQSLTFDTSVFCNWMLLSGQFVLIIAGLVSLRLIAGGL